MAEIRTSMRSGQKYKMIVLTLICLISAAYGGWQYWIRLPERETIFTQYTQAVEVHNQLVAKAEKQTAVGGTLSPEEVSAYEEAEAVLTTYADDKPQKPSKYDGLISLVVWFAGGLSGVPFLIWPLWKHRNGGWVLEDDDTLKSPKGELFQDASIKDIDMSTWRGMINPQASNKTTWQAKLILENQRKVVLDDYPWDGVSRIIAHYAHRFHPDTWDENGNPIQEGIDKASNSLEAEDKAKSKG
jgi:hypothetical protein